MNLSKFAEDTFAEYEKWVRLHPNTLSEVESVLRYLSYFFASQFENSNLISELIYSLSKLLVFFNDQIIYSASPAALASNPYRDQLKKWLTIIEHCEVFIELSAQKAWGTRGKWIMISIVQIFKSILRLCLLFHKKEQIVEPSPIHFLDRKHLNTQTMDQYLTKECVELKNGRIIRTVEATSSSADSRKWISNSKNYSTHDKKLDHNQTIAEVLYICKPLLHLGSLYCFGTQSWKPWMLALILDVSSIHMLTKTSSNKSAEKFSRRQQTEITRRSIALLWYLMRSPFYDKKTKQQIFSTLQTLSKMPLFGIFCKSLVDYLPQWQRTYFYLWSS